LETPLNLAARRLGALALATGLILGSVTVSQGAPSLVALAKPVVRGALNTQSIYFVMTDRYANGDPSNDLAHVADFRLTSGYDSSDPGWYHGGDLKGLTQNLSYIKKMGFTSIWITPPVKQQYVQGGSAAYHGYWGIDFTTIDPHLGTEADFKNLVDQAHALGLKVIVDIVVNHTADIIKYRDNGSAYIPLGLAKVKKPTWLNTMANYHNVGDIGTSPKATTLAGDFYGLDDLNTGKPAVVQGWTDLWSSWITKYGIDGYRIDTAKYVDEAFWKSFLPAILKTAKSVGKSSFAIFGEIADANPEAIAPFVTEQSFPSALDFPFQNAVTNYAKSFGQAAPLGELFNADDLYTSATSSAYGLATFLGNHDMGRIGYFITKAAAWDGETVLLERDILAHAMLFLLRGGPVVYYGDEKGMAGGGGDKLARQDMFPTQVDLWKTETRIGAAPIGDGSSFDVANPIQDEIVALQNLEVQYPDLKTGTQQLRYAQGNFFAVSRFNSDQEFLVAFNSDDKPTTATVPVATLSSAWEPIFGLGSSTSSSPNSLDITLPPHGFIVLKAANKFVPSQTLKITILAPKTDGNSDGWIPVTASVPGSDFDQVTFAVQVPGKAWQSLGTSDHRTLKTPQTAGGLFRSYIHPALYKKGTVLNLVAIVKNSAGETLASKVIRYSIN
jgi:glycosidase